eukprot:1079623-Pyramimonas_sp.AAC.1
MEGRARGTKSLYLGLIKSTARFNVYGFSCLTFIGQFFLPTKFALGRMREAGQAPTNAPRNAIPTALLQGFTSVGARVQTRDLE